MRRREFITLLGGAAVLPLGARAQQNPSLPKFAQKSDHLSVIGVLLPGTPDSFGPYLGALQKGLKELQYVEGRDFVFELRSAEGSLDRLPILATDLVNRKVDVIVVASRQATVAALQATTNIPII